MKTVDASTMTGTSYIQAEELQSVPSVTRTSTSAWADMSYRKVETALLPPATQSYSAAAIIPCNQGGMGNYTSTSHTKEQVFLKDVTFMTYSASDSTSTVVPCSTDKPSTSKDASSSTSILMPNNQASISQHVTTKDASVMTDSTSNVMLEDKCVQVYEENDTTGRGMKKGIYRSHFRIGKLSQHDLTTISSDQKKCVNHKRSLSDSDCIRPQKTYTILGSDSLPLSEPVTLLRRPLRKVMDDTRSVSKEPNIGRSKRMLHSISCESSGEGFDQQKRSGSGHRCNYQQQLKTVQQRLRSLRKQVYKNDLLSEV